MKITKQDIKKYSTLEEQKLLEDNRKKSVIDQINDYINDIAWMGDHPGFIEYNELLDKIKEINQKDSETIKEMPICPYCHSEMEISSYKGYYDSFPYWQCECDDDFLEKKATNKAFGSYA